MALVSAGIFPEFHGNIGQKRTFTSSFGKNNYKQDFMMPEKNNIPPLFPLIISSIYSPREAFATLAGRPVLFLALLLMGVRYGVATFATVINLYYHYEPMLLPVPVAIAPQLYRYYEIYWYGPYGILMLFVIAKVLLIMSRSTNQEGIRINFNDVLAITSLAFFTPWLVTLPLDIAVIASGHGTPHILVPLHLSILAWESVLVVVGVQSRLGLPATKGLKYGVAAAGIFIFMGGVLIR